MTGVATYKRYGRTVWPAKIDPVELIKTMIRDLKGEGDLDPKSAGSWMDGVQVLRNNSTGAENELAKAYAEASQGWNDSQRPGGIRTLRDFLKKAQKKIKKVNESKGTGGGMRALIERLEGLEEAKKIKWGFDTTDFGSAAKFQKIIDEFGLKPSKETKKAPGGDYYSYWWKGPGISIVTGNNPITGEYMSPKNRDPEKGFASYIGLEGEEEKVKAAVAMIKKLGAYKGESKGKREFI